MDKFYLPILIPGALTADKHVYFKAPHDMQLIHVYARCTTQAATLLIGSTTDADAYLYDNATADTGAAIAVDTDYEFDRDDFVGDQFPHIADGTVIDVLVGHGSNCVDFLAVLVFTDG